jgi:hypothetical protein
VTLSALFLTVPEAEPLLDAVRGMPGVALLEPAHISLGYPWLPDAHLHVQEVCDAAAAVASGTVRLQGPELFSQDIRRRTVVHAQLSDESIPRALAALLGAPLRTPHLSIARVRHHGDLAAVVDAVAHLLPLTVHLDCLELTVKTTTGWETLVRAPLGIAVS